MARRATRGTRPAIRGSMTALVLNARSRDAEESIRAALGAIYTATASVSMGNLCFVAFGGQAGEDTVDVCLQIRDGPVFGDCEAESHPCEPTYFATAVERSPGVCLFFGGYDRFGRLSAKIQRAEQSLVLPTRRVVWRSFPVDAAGPSARLGCAAAADGGAVYVWGGFTESDGLEAVDDDLYRLSPGAGGAVYQAGQNADFLGVWAVVQVSGAKPHARAWHSFDSCGPGRLLLHGGVQDVGATGVFGDLHVFEVATSTWSPVSATLPLRFGHAVASLEPGRLLVFGGATGAAAVANDFAVVEVDERLQSTVRTPTVTGAPIGQVGAALFARRTAPQTYQLALFGGWRLENGSTPVAASITSSSDEEPGFEMWTGTLTG